LNRANFAMQREDAALLKISLLEVVRINPQNKQAQELLNTRF
jgi:hypothetical protein